MLLQGFSRVPKLVCEGSSLRSAAVYGRCSLLINFINFYSICQSSAGFRSQMVAGAVKVSFQAFLIIIQLIP